MFLKPSLAVACAALCLPAVASAAPSSEKVTGGGQIIAEGAKGPGDTIAFTAQGDGNSNTASAKGQLQYNQRSTGFKVHGVVDCMQVLRDGDEATANQAVIGGTYRDDPGERFRVYVVDNGQGANAAGLDMIAFEPADEEQDAEDGRGTCEPDDDSFDNLPALGRGNVKIHKSKAAASKRNLAASFSSALKLMRFSL